MSKTHITIEETTSRLCHHEHAVADSAQVLRLAVRDRQQLRPPPPGQTIFFAPASGKGLQGDAAPGIVSFLDYHWRPDGTIYLDYISTRKDQCGKGYARLLLDTLFRKYPNTPIDFGGVQSPTIWRYYEKKAAEGVTVYAHDWDEEEGTEKW